MQIADAFTYKIRCPDPGHYWYYPHIREAFTQEMGSVWLDSPGGGFATYQVGFGSDRVATIVVMSRAQSEG